MADGASEVTARDKGVMGQGQECEEKAQRGENLVMLRFHCLGVFHGALRLKMQAGNANSHGEHCKIHTHTHTYSDTRLGKRKTFKRYLFECK